LAYFSGKQSSWVGLGHRFFEFLSSLKLAVVVILVLALFLGVATFLEASYDTPTAQYFVYDAWFFKAWLGLLGANILAVVIQRYPWKKRHFSFLLAHFGILILLLGSWITHELGVDGTLRVSEGETAGVLALPGTFLSFLSSGKSYQVPFMWQPPGMPFRPWVLAQKGLPYAWMVDQFLSHADAVVAFESSKLVSAESSALHIQWTSALMGVSQDFWLWEGAPSWSQIQLGPAQIAISSDLSVLKGLRAPCILFQPGAGGSLKYHAFSSEKARLTGVLLPGKVQAERIRLPWKGNPELFIEKWMPHATMITSYVPSKTQYGNQAPGPAIHLRDIRDPRLGEAWLGLGDHVTLKMGRGDGVEEEVLCGYDHKKLLLPFSLRLDHFFVDYHPGTSQPAEYRSQVTVHEASHVISMNRPLVVSGYTLYQASYEEASPRPVTSLFSVNRDPGRRWKYLGSLFLVLGSCLLFVRRSKR